MEGAATFVLALVVRGVETALVAPSRGWAAIAAAASSSFRFFEATVCTVATDLDCCCLSHQMATVALGSRSNMERVATTSCFVDPALFGGRHDSSNTVFVR